jgi:hypothetical protein
LEFFFTFWGLKKIIARYTGVNFRLKCDCECH